MSTNLEMNNSMKTVFFGTGRVAKDFYKKYCIEKQFIAKPMYWCDNAKEKQGTFLYDIEIISPEKLQELSENNYTNPSDKEFVVIIATTGTNLLQIISQFEQMSLKVKVYSAIQIHAQQYFNENDDKINEIIEMFDDDKSCRIYRKMIDNMKLGNCVDFVVAEPNQYIGNDVIMNLQDDEVIIDAGVCNGEEIDKALQMNKNICIYAFEPDCKSMNSLKKKYKNEKNVILCPYALWDKEDNLKFSTNTAMPSASRVSTEQISEGNIIHAMPLDKLLAKEKVTLIKMDIEGAEYKALLGAEKIIKTYKPKLAICIYHSIEDYVQIPLLIQEMNPNYKFYFRQHSVTSSESVFYAI